MSAGTANVHGGLTLRPALLAALVRVCSLALLAGLLFHGLLDGFSHLLTFCLARSI